MASKYRDCKHEPGAERVYFYTRQCKKCGVLMETYPGEGAGFYEVWHPVEVSILHHEIIDLQEQINDLREAHRE